MVADYKTPLVYGFVAFMIVYAVLMVLFSLNLIGYNPYMYTNAFDRNESTAYAYTVQILIAIVSDGVGFLVAAITIILKNDIAVTAKQ